MERVHREIRRENRRRAAELPDRQSNAQKLKDERVMNGVLLLPVLRERANETTEQRKKRHDKRRKSS